MRVISQYLCFFLLLRAEGIPLVEKLHLVLQGVLGDGIPQLGGSFPFLVAFELEFSRKYVSGWDLGVAFDGVVNREMTFSCYVLGLVVLVAEFHFDLENLEE